MAQRRKAKARRRSEYGGATVVSALLLILLVLVTAPGMVFYANASTHLRLHAQATHIAAQTAQVVDDYKYWLDAPRPGFDRDHETTAKAAAADAAHTMCKLLGLKRPQVDISFETDTDGNQLTICRLRADSSDLIPSPVTICGIDMHQLFPGKIDVQGVSSHSGIQPYSLIHMDAPVLSDESVRRPLGFNQRDVALVPAYGFFYNPTGESGNTHTTAYGKGLAGPLVPDGYRAMNHYHFKKIDLDQVVQQDWQSRLSSWNSGTKYDNTENYYKSH